MKRFCTTMNWTKEPKLQFQLWLNYYYTKSDKYNLIPAIFARWILVAFAVLVFSDTKSRVINLLLTEFSRDRTGRISALCLSCKDLAEAARSVLPRPRADILPVRPSHSVNKIYVIKFRMYPVGRRAKRLGNPAGHTVHLQPVRILWVAEERNARTYAWGVVGIIRHMWQHLFIFIFDRPRPNHGNAAINQTKLRLRSS